ncbi:MAG: amidohydrolase [Clostridiaceae bacterium]|nr:amidohydrolase [Clostridiaceae bacterium]
MIFIKNGTIFTGKNFKKASIFIKDGKITDVGVNIIAPGECKVVEAEGKMVMPGFIDAHCHLGMIEDSIGFEGDDVNEMTDPITPQLRAIDAINPMDKTFREAYGEGGVTCVASGPGSANVIGGQYVVIKTYGKRIDDMVMKDPVAMKCAFGENPKRVYRDKKQSPSTRMATAAKLRETLSKAREYYEKLEAAKEDVSKKPAFDMKLEALIPVIKGEIPLKAHAHRADDIFTAIRIAKEFNVKMTLDHCTEGHLIANYIKEEGYNTIVGPTLGHRTKFELRDKDFKTPGVLSRAGVKVAITTDSPVIPLQHLPMCGALAVKAGMDEVEALKALTIYPAEILGIQDRVGSIEIGKDADIVIWDKHPFDLQASVECVVMNGEVVK